MTRTDKIGIALIAIILALFGMVNAFMTIGERHYEYCIDQGKPVDVCENHLLGVD